MEDFDQEPYGKSFAIVLTIINTIIFLPLSGLMAFSVLAASAIGAGTGGGAGAILIPGLILILAPILTIICIFASIILLSAGKPERAEKFCIIPFFYTLGCGIIILIFVVAVN